MSASAALSDAAAGASLGAVAGPYGALIGGVVGLGAGLLTKDPKKAAKNNLARPTYAIPKEEYQNQAMYQAMANSSRVPGQSYIENQIGQNTAQSINASQRAAGSSADALAAVGGIQQNANDMYNQLGMEGAQLQMQNKDKLANANNELADYKQQAFDYNQNQPYQISYAQKQKIQDQQYMNNNNAVNSLAELGMTYAGARMGSNDSTGTPGGNNNPYGANQLSATGTGTGKATPYDSIKKYKYTPKR